jgi:PHD/YefM family antitoxin component YafN of YafNO toxin-antitoxin module
MKAIETTATIDNRGQLSLDEPLQLVTNRRVRVIVLISEEEFDEDPDDTPTEVAIEGIRQGLHEAFSGQTIPIAQMWDGIDAE